MSGDSESALKGAATKRLKYGNDWFAIQGAKGGLKRKGKKHTKAAKRKISKSMKRRSHEIKDSKVSS